MRLRGARLVLVLVVGSLLAALAAEALVRTRDLPGASHLVGLGLLYLAWWIALSGAISRVSGSPLRWFTISAPIAAAILVFVGEVAIARDAPWVGELASTLGLFLFLAVPITTILGSRRDEQPWKTGLVAWSLLLYQAAVSVAALSGILFGTFGTESRADELMFIAVIPPLIALLVATAVAPSLSRGARIAAGALALIAIAGVLFSTSDGGPGLLVAVSSIGGLLMIVDSIGRPKTRSRHRRCLVPQRGPR